MMVCQSVIFFSFNHVFKKLIYLHICIQIVRNNDVLLCRLQILQQQLIRLRHSHWDKSIITKNKSISPKKLNCTQGCWRTYWHAIRKDTFDYNIIHIPWNTYIQTWLLTLVIWPCIQTCKIFVRWLKMNRWNQRRNMFFFDVIIMDFHFLTSSNGMFFPLQKTQVIFLLFPPNYLSCDKTNRFFSTFEPFAGSL